MIPESLAGVPRVTAGEARLFRALQQKLDDSTLVWFNVPVRGRYVVLQGLEVRPRARELP